MNPCPCGFWNDPTRECRCSPLQIQRYVGRISGPLLDRIDIHIDVPAVKFRELAGEEAPETDSSDTIRNRVIVARERQLKRFRGEKIFSNAAMTPRMIRKHCQIDTASEQLLEQAMIRQGLSARAYDRILKVSRTIADLQGCDHIGATHGPVTLSGIEGALRVNATESETSLTLTGGEVSVTIAAGNVNLVIPVRSWRGSGVEVRIAAGVLNVEIPAGFNGDIDADVLRMGKIAYDYEGLETREKPGITERTIRARAGSGGPFFKFTVGDGLIGIKKMNQ